MWINATVIKISARIAKSKSASGIPDLAFKNLHLYIVLTVSLYFNYSDMYSKQLCLLCLLRRSCNIDSTGWDDHPRFHIASQKTSCEY